jgi:hypothetical protein
MTRLQQDIAGYLHSPVTAAEVQTAAYVRFAAWMAAHDTGPRSVTVGQIGREFRNLSYATICRWIRHYRAQREEQGQ